MKGLRISMIGLTAGLLSVLSAEWVVAADDWREKLAQELPKLGHRNWIVIADSAYPQQVAPGIETLYVGGDHLNVVESVLKSIDQTRHVQPVIFVDRELEFVPAKYADGIGPFREQLSQILSERNVHTLAHEKIIGQLDEAGQAFRVLIIKTDLALPYTSVFVRLEARYWSGAAEKALREAMQHPPDSAGKAAGN